MHLHHSPSVPFMRNNASLTLFSSKSPSRNWSCSARSSEALGSARTGGLVYRNQCGEPMDTDRYTEASTLRTPAITRAVACRLSTIAPLDQRRRVAMCLRALYSAHLLHSICQPENKHGQSLRFNISELIRVNAFMC